MARGHVRAEPRHIQFIGQRDEVVVIVGWARDHQVNRIAADINGGERRYISQGSLLPSIGVTVAARAQNLFQVIPVSC